MPYVRLEADVVGPHLHTKHLEQRHPKRAEAIDVLLKAMKKVGFVVRSLLWDYVPGVVV